METETIIGIASAVIAVGSAVLSGYFSRRSIGIAERARRQQYFNELRQWADEASNVLSEAVHLCDIDPSLTLSPNLSERKNEILARLSSLIDRGR